MAQLSQLGFWMFSGALGAVGVAASVGVLDQPPRNAPIAKTALVGEQISGSNATQKPADEKVAKLTSKPDAVAEKPKVIAPKVIIPTFGLLRVEENVSTLIAGHAEPNSKVEIFDGVDIVATTTAANNGDFAALLDKPLSPGDHQLGIRATDKDSQVQVSTETGLVSMPKKKDDQMLAMVMKPGEASRLIQKPDAAKPVEPVKIAKVEPKKTTEPKVIAKSGPKPVEPKSAPKKPATEMAIEPKPEKVEVPQVQVAKVEVKAPAKPLAEPIQKIAEKVEPVVIEKAKENIQLASKPAEEKLAEPTKEVVASVAKKPVVVKIPEKSKPAEKAPTIIVEAVEVDGPRMFIAGAAEPGRRVAIYVDNKLVGFADGSREGRFLLEVERSLTKGEHVVRADIYDAKGVIVAARAEVPLIHEPEEPAVVVAKVEPAVKPAETTLPKAKPVVEVEETKITPKPVVEAKAAVVEKTEIEPKQTISAAIVKPDTKAVIKKEPAEVAMVTPTKPKVDQPKKAVVPVKPMEAKIVAEKPAELKKPAEAKAEINTAAATPASAKIEAPEKMPVIIEPKAQAEIKVASTASRIVPAPRRVLRTGSSVIIRRGDSLWRISYRTYGRGIRYSTIYQANLRQLRSPHKIYPGQILKVPKKKFSEQG